MGACVCKSNQEPHYCGDTCLVNYKQENQQELLKALKNYHAEYIIDIIIEYLPTYGLEEYIQESTNLKSYFHQQSLSYYIDKQMPCTKWRSFVPNDTNTHWRNIPEIKVSIWGSKQCGKSTLAYRLVRDYFVEEIDPTIEERMQKQIEVNGCHVLYDILDPWLYEEYQALNKLWMRESELFIICFAINDGKSFEEVIYWRQQIFDAKEVHEDDKPEFAMILVATKCDLRDDEQWIKQNDAKFVDNELIMEYVYKWNIPYIEMSSKSGDNVDTLFEHSLYELWMQTQTGCSIKQN